MQIVGAILLLVSAQLMSLQPKRIVHLAPHKNAIKVEWHGCVLELINAPKIIQLPLEPPQSDTDGNQWTIEIKNLGPRPVTITDEQTHFIVTDTVGQTLRIRSDGAEYFLQR